MNGYNLLAPFYDVLVKVIFGNKIKSLQTAHLNKIPDNSKVLILGGGTGWILEEIDDKAKNVEITYIDLSSKMIDKSKNRRVNNNQVEFIEGTENDIPFIQYDVLITNFYLDLFPEKKLLEIIKQLSELDCSLWIWTDFVPNKSYKWLEEIMILFFKCFTGLSNNQVYYYGQLIEQHTDYKTSGRVTKMKGFLVSAVMQNKSV